MNHEVRLYTICLEAEGALEVQEALNLATPEEAAEAFFDEALRRGEGEWDDKKMQLPQDAKFIGATKSGSGNIYHCADTYFLASIETTKLNEAQLKKLVMESVKKVLRESVQNAVQEVMSNPAAYGLDQVPLKTKVRRGMKGDVVYADFVEKKHFQNMKENEEGWVVRLAGRYYVLHIYWKVGSPMVPGDNGLSLVVKDFISFQSEQPVSGFDRLGTAEILKNLIIRKANKMATEI